MKTDPEMASAAEPDGFTPLTGRRLFVAGFVLAVSNFMVVLDMTIANVSVPHIAGGLGISPSQGVWVITSYSVAEAITVPLTGWLAMRFGTVRWFVFGLAGFAFFSFLCGLSNSLTMLVLCRVGQGLTGGPLMPLTQTLMVRIFPPEKRAQAMGRLETLRKIMAYNSRCAQCSPTSRRILRNETGSDPGGQHCAKYRVQRLSEG